MVAGARQAARSTGNFMHKHPKGLQRTVRERKYPVSSSSVGENALMMLENGHTGPS